MPLGPRRHRRGLKTGGRWTEDERQRLWRLRSENSTLSWGRFHQKFFPNRSLNALQKAHSVMSLEKKKLDMMNNNTSKIRGRVVKRSQPDQGNQGGRLVKQAKTTGDIPFEGGRVEETDGSGSTEASASESDSDSGEESDEETLQGPAIDSQESTNKSDASLGKEVNDETREEEGPHLTDTSKPAPSASPSTDKQKSGKLTTEEKRNVVNSPSDPATVPSEDPFTLPPYMQFLETTLLQYKMMMWKNRDQERVTTALQEEVDTLKELNNNKEDKIASLQEEVRNHLQTIRSLTQAKNGYKDEVNRQKSANQLLSSQNAVLEQKLVIVRNDRKCETCARVSELISPSLAKPKAG
ncbi:hypothetical protein BO78DRAFT_424787 [Aspergillus sclerotiicarbonarius CBS 121057]|uniref:Myb-like domain-containing protein n=1 Tax=Aspergillus sclerotiicarbonarius (strain CBS 121057 / IBT 28362) TaxID=1448318 RepID=A0A319F301_ASPSB|nr:hypothetical protein BO78DRAFT_424787 [Aspergillus sclerotiicarbonarius CBS 121057]